MKIWIVDGKFVELTEEQVKSLSVQQLGEYTSDKTKHQLDSFKEEYRRIAEKAAEGKMSKDEVTSALKTLEEKSENFTKEQLKELSGKLSTVEEQLKEAQKNLKALGEKGMNAPAPEKVGFGTLLRKQLEKDGLVEEYVIDAALGKKAFKVKDYDKSSMKYSVKAAIDMTTALSVAPGADPGTNIGSITDYKMRDVLINLTKDVHATQFLPTDPVSDKYMGVLVEHTYEDGTGTKAEGSASSKSSIKFKTIEFKVFTIATYFRVSKENLADIDRLESKLNRIAPDKILSTLDGKIFSALGDNSADIKGMYVAGNYTAFTAATFAASVEDANIIDLVRKMKLQAHNADEDVNAVVLHPSQIDEIEALKDANKNYLQSRGIVFDAMGNLVRLHGLAVIRNKKPTTSRVTVMWNEAAEIGIREDINYEIGLDGNDLTEGMRTIVFEMRAAFGVGKPGGIIVSTDPTGDIAVINKGVA